MTAEPQWNSTRWRDDGGTPRYDSLQHPQHSALHTPQTGSRESPGQPWFGPSSDHAQAYPYDSRRPSQTFSGQQSHYAQSDRSSQHGGYGSTSHSSPRHATNHGTWRSDTSQATGTGDSRSADASLSLQIPKSTSELPSFAHGYITPRSDATMYGGNNNSLDRKTTSLPSFAALSEQTNRTYEPDDVEIAPMSARLSCTQCATLAPLIHEIATHVAELDGHVQSFCSTAESRSSDIPRESATRTVQWILDRMRYTKRDMQGVARGGTSDQDRAASRSYPNSLKRPGEQWEQDDMPTLKLPRPSTTPFDATSLDRRASIDFAMRDSNNPSAYSPAPSDSAPGSAYPRPGSPVSVRLPRTLPSPSSLAFQQSGHASFVPANAGSVGSPGTSYHPGSSIHNVSTSSATSAHLQDLQHQVSLKSLALQTLQTEYATLLQKLQRERIKSQTIEKKTTVADQEVNDLTTRNEELTEQVKSMEGQLQECERKRESERLEAVKEKEQWGRMLDMSGRLQNRSATDYQRVAKEKAELQQRLNSYEASGLRPGEISRHASRSPLPDAGGSSTEVEALRHENDSLQAKVDAMRSAVQELSRQYGALDENIEQLVTRRDSLWKSMAEVAGESVLNTREEAAPLKPTETGGSFRKPQRTRSENPLPSPLSALPTSTSVGSERPDPFSRESLARTARAVSPGPAELGFHVQPSTSSPEEIVRALGPVPTPLPSIRYPDDWPSVSRGGGRRPSQPFVAAPLSMPDAQGSSTFPQMSSFRPLNQDYPPTTTSQPSYSPQHPYTSYSPGPSGPATNPSTTSSPGSTSMHSPEYRHPHPGLAREEWHSHSTAAMPPPPRPLP